MAEEAVVRIDPLAHKTVGELDELEEEGGEYADSRVLESYREARIAEMKRLAAANKFGAVFPLSRADFVEDVTEASKEAYVCVLLYQDHLPESKLLQAVWPQVAAQHRATKFMSIRADACIENYPDKNVPTILVYHEGKSQVPIIGLSELGGTRVDAKSEWVGGGGWRAPCSVRARMGTPAPPRHGTHVLVCRMRVLGCVVLCVPASLVRVAPLPPPHPLLHPIACSLPMSEKRCRKSVWPYTTIRNHIKRLAFDAGDRLLRVWTAFAPCVALRSPPPPLTFVPPSPPSPSPITLCSRRVGPLPPRRRQD
jgi:hypothetical protein